MTHTQTTPLKPAHAKRLLNAQTAKQAARYIERFVARRTKSARQA
jgi:hypothetical protein